MQLAERTIAFGDKRRWRINYNKWLQRGETINELIVVLEGNAEITNKTISSNKKYIWFTVEPADEYVGQTRDVTIQVFTTRHQRRTDTISLTTVDGPGNLD